MIILGIDPGLNGALAFYDTQEQSLLVIDMPTVEIVRGGKTKREVNGTLLSNAIITSAVEKPRVAYVERVGAMPKQGVSGMFSFGRSMGLIEGVLAAWDIPMRLVNPKEWRKFSDCPDGKDGSRVAVMRLYPNATESFKLKKHDGRADATLIMHYGRMKFA